MATTQNSYAILLEQSVDFKKTRRYALRKQAIVNKLTTKDIVEILGVSDAWASLLLKKLQLGKLNNQEFHLFIDYTKVEARIDEMNADETYASDIERISSDDLSFNLVLEDAEQEVKKQMRIYLHQIDEYAIAHLSRTKNK